LSLAAGVSLFSLARRMGTSVEMIDRTYGHLAPDEEEYERGLLDAYAAKTEGVWAAIEQGGRRVVRAGTCKSPANC
jgi:hypothetical protein